MSKMRGTLAATVAALVLASVNLASAGEQSGSQPDHVALTGVVQTYCQSCHNDRMLTGNLSLEGFDVAGAAMNPDSTARTENGNIRQASGLAVSPDRTWIVQSPCSFKKTQAPSGRLLSTQLRFTRR